MNRRLPLGSPAAAADSETISPAAVSRPARRLIAVMLIAAAALDLTRCGLLMVAIRHHPPAAGLVVIGLAAAALSVRIARGCQSGQRWAVWAALLIGAASAPQAAVSGFSAPYTIPDTATAVLGVLLAVAVLATADRIGVAGDRIRTPCVITRDSDDPRCSRARTSSRGARHHRCRRTREGRCGSRNASAAVGSVCSGNRGTRTRSTEECPK